MTQQAQETTPNSAETATTDTPITAPEVKVEAPVAPPAPPKAAPAKKPAPVKKTAAAPRAPAKKPAPAAAVEASPAAPVAPASKTEEKPAKPRKVKLVRDSFAMPDTEYARLQTMKKALQGKFKKSEILRAGLALMAALPPEGLLSAVEQVERIKTGRPKKK